jgi:hypothetical protein
LVGLQYRSGTQGSTGCAATADANERGVPLTRKSQHLRVAVAPAIDDFLWRLATEIYRRNQLLLMMSPGAGLPSCLAPLQ